MAEFINKIHHKFVKTKEKLPVASQKSYELECKITALFEEYDIKTFAVAFLCDGKGVLTREGHPTTIITLLKSIIDAEILEDDGDEQ